MPSRYRGSVGARFALNAYISLVRAAESVMAEHLEPLSQHGLTMGQFGALEALYHVGSLAQSELGKKLLRSGGNITMVIDNLEKRRLVQRVRQEDDRRVVRVALTNAGKELVEGIMPAHVKLIQEQFSHISREDQVKLRDLCKAIGLRAVHRRKERRKQETR